MDIKSIDFLDNVVKEKNEKVESKAKSYYLEVEVINGIKTLAQEVSKTDSQFVNDILKAVVKRYLDESK